MGEARFEPTKIAEMHVQCCGPAMQSLCVVHASDKRLIRECAWGQATVAHSAPAMQSLCVVHGSDKRLIQECAWGASDGRSYSAGDAIALCCACAYTQAVRARDASK